MTTSGWAWLVAAGVLAVLDWIAVGRTARAIERVAKPLVVVALIGAALTTPGSDVRGWLLAGLAFGLVGDVVLTFERQPAGPVLAELNSVRSLPPAAGAVRTTAPPAPPGLIPAWDGRSFLVGLAAFLVGHLCYVAALLSYGIDRLSVVFGLLLVLMALLSFGYRIIAGAQVQGGPMLTVAVTLYMVALGSVVVLGVGTAQLWIAAGVVLFALSDLMLGYDRFVQARSWAPIAVIVTYHLAQALLIIGLVG